ncbi:MAG: histidine kinase dimerization/phosphoacceptor domain -containing protein [Cyclobacteriaceae bacterium]
MTRLSSYSTYSFPEKSILKVLKTILQIIPFAAVLIAASNFSLGRQVIAIIVLTVPLFSLVCLGLLKKGKHQLVIYLMVSLVSVIVTISGIMGNGIHENSIIAFPVIVLLSTFIMNGKGVVISSIIAITCLAILCFGEMFELFPKRPYPVSQIADVISISSILLLTIFVFHYLAKVTKESMKHAVAEINNQQQIQGRIRENLEVKSHLLKEVHHRIKNNLSLINSLIDLEIMDSDMKTVDLKTLQSRVQTIARVHDPLFQSLDYQKVDVKNYLEKLIMGRTGFSSLPESVLNISIEQKELSIEKAIPLGIILHELMNQFKPHSTSILSITLSFSKGEGIFSFGKFANSAAYEKELIHLMSDELAATCEFERDQFKLVFDTCD